MIPGSNGSSTLDVSQQLQHNTGAGMLDLINSLRQQRSLRDAAPWEQFVVDLRRTDLCDLIHEDPFTRHSFEKPRGYSGDALLLDMIYSKTPTEPESITPVGQKIFDFSIDSPAPEAVRQRRVRIGAEFNQLAAEQSNAKILSVACGHLRELELLTAPNSFQITAIDQDPLSLDVIRRDYPNHSIELLPLSIKSLLSRPQLPSDFDFIYSAGLYDYFSQPMARRVTKALFELLAPGGKLLIANFCPNIRDVGYMECFMDWWLTYRDETEMQDLVADIPKSNLQQQTLSRDAAGQIVYLELVAS